MMGTGMPYLVRVGVRLRVRVGVGVRVRDAALPDEHLAILTKAILTMAHSQMSIFLSSAVVTNRLAFSQKVIVLTAARCWS